MTRIILVRHAQAATPDDLRLPGTDLPLLPAGRRQVVALADRLAILRPVAVWASDARRARETAEIIAARCRLPSVLRPGLRELDFGQWGGRTYADVAASDAAAAGWFADPAVGAPPGGEHPADAAARVLAELASLAAGNDGPVVVVGHAGSLRLALATALGMPLAAAWRLRLDCAGLSVLDWTEAGPVVERLNDTGHLPGLTGEGEPGDGPALKDRSDEESTPKGAPGERSAADVGGGLMERAGRDGAREQAGEQEQAGRPGIGGGHAGDATVTFILGGARSGKSTLAERLAAESARPVLYLATSVPFDDEMADRITVHRSERPADWRTIEEPLRIAAAVQKRARPGDLVLLDCLTVWLSNLLLDGIGPNRDPDAVPAADWIALEAAALAEIDALLADARARGVALVLVSNEVGMGVVPAYPLGRRYRDALGRVNQRAAAHADTVLLMVAGLPLDLKSTRQ